MQINSTLTAVCGKIKTFVMFSTTQNLSESSCLNMHGYVGKVWREICSGAHT